MRRNHSKFQHGFLSLNVDRENGNLLLFLFQLERFQRGVLSGEVDGDVLAVEFGEAGFREAGDQLAIIAILTDVGEDQMLRIRGEEFFQCRHRIGVAEMSDPARDAPFERKTAF